MQILVTGGTGFVGRHLCRELDERGHDVTALSRSPDPAVLPDGVETATGDVTEYDTIETVFEGMDAVVHLVALTVLKKPRGGSRAYDRVHVGGTENVVRAAEEHGVDRLVYLSGTGADPEAPTAYLRTKGEAEALVRESDLEWVILRPAVIVGEDCEFVPFMKLLAPPYLTPLPGGGRTEFEPIWIGDLAPMIADAVEADEHAGRTYEIAGPERLTMAEIARLIHRSDGRRATVIPIPMALARLGLAIGEAIPGFPFGLDQYRSLRLELLVDENDIGAFGVSPADLTTFEAYLVGSI